MKFRNLKIFVALILVSAFIMPVQSVFAEDGNVKVQLLTINDFHGQMDTVDHFDVDGDGEDDAVGRVDYLAAYLKQAESTNPNTLLLEVGDMIGASPIISSYWQDEPTVQVMEQMGVDIGVVGNHEFDEGVEEMLRMVNGGDHPSGTENYDGIDFPMLGANVYYKDTNERMLDPYVIKEIDGQKIAFVGVVTKTTPEETVKKGNENVIFTDEAEAINKVIPEIKAKGIKAIVVLAHVAGYQDDEGNITGPIANIANNVDDEVDVILSAHNHVMNNGLVDGKLIVQAYSYGTAYGDVNLEIDPATGDIVKKSAEVVTVIDKNVEPNPEVATILNDYQEKIKPVKERVIGEAAIDLEGGYGVKGPVGDNALGNLIADGMVKAMDADFALMNGGGIRNDIAKGEITWGDLFSVQPFGNTLNKVELTGDDLRKVLNAQISPKYGPDVSVAGFKYTWDGSTNEVVDMFLPDGSKIDPDKTYSVVVNNYMYGAEKYRLEELGENMEIGPTDIQATVDYVSSFDGPITYEAEGRISEVTPTPEKADPKANDFKYVVKSGDTLGAIGAQYGVHWKKLAEYNNIKDVRKLMPGQEIYIPVPEGTDEYNVYLVKKGDTLGKIAAANKVDWKDLAAYNKLDNPHFLTIGQEIKIPK